MRRGVAATSTLLLSALVLAGPAAAQAVTNGAEANDTVQIVKSSLMGIAVGLLVLTIFYWIHTDPKRRARAHAKKQARKDAFAESREQHLVTDAEGGAFGSVDDFADLGPVGESANEPDDLDTAIVELVDDEYELPEVEREVS